jgi:hypothetical protein
MLTGYQHSLVRATMPTVIRTGEVKEIIKEFCIFED